MIKQFLIKQKSVINKAKEDGHVVMIATGRPFRSSEMYYRELEFRHTHCQF